MDGQACLYSLGDIRGATVIERQCREMSGVSRIGWGKEASPIRSSKGNCGERKDFSDTSV